MLSDAIKSKENQEVVVTLENSKKAIQALQDYSTGKKKYDDAPARLTLKDAIREANSDPGLKSKGQLYWFSVPKKMTKDNFDKYLDDETEEGESQDLPDAFKLKKEHKMKTISKIFKEVMSTDAMQSKANIKSVEAKEKYQQIYDYLENTKQIVVRDIVPKYSSNFDKLVDDIAGKENKGKEEYVATEQAIIDWFYDNGYGIINNRIVQMRTG